MYEVASILRISAGEQVSVAMTVEKLGAEIQSDTVYKHLRQTLASNVQMTKYVGELAIYKPKVLRAGLLKALHCGHLWPNLKEDIVQIIAWCLLCHQNAPSQPKEPSIGVQSKNYTFESLSMDNFFFKMN